MIQRKRTFVCGKSHIIIIIIKNSQNFLIYNIGQNVMKNVIVVLSHLSHVSHIFYKKNNKSIYYYEYYYYEYYYNHNNHNINHNNKCHTSINFSETYDMCDMCDKAIIYIIKNVFLKDFMSKKNVLQDALQKNEKPNIIIIIK
jgi:hypothetical protein